MSKNSLISVIIVFLNEERFIKEAIESVLAQRYQIWELILVDDGSTDGSSSIARGYQAIYPSQVRFYSHPGDQNCGMSVSRNLGLMHAKGDYVSYLDADDVWLPEKLVQQIAILYSYPDCAMVYGAWQFWYSWSGRPEDIKRDEIYLALDGMPLHTQIMSPKFLTSMLVNGGVCPHGPLIRRNSIEAVGGYEDSFREMYEDQAFFAKLSLEFPIIISETCWLRYRRHENSCVFAAHKAGQKNVARRNFLEWLDRYLSQRGLDGLEVWQIVQDQLLLL